MLWPGIKPMTSHPIADTFYLIPNMQFGLLWPFKGGGVKVMMTPKEDMVGTGGVKTHLGHWMSNFSQSPSNWYQRWLYLEIDTYWPLKGLGSGLRWARPNLVIYCWSAQDLRLDIKHGYIWGLTFFAFWGQGQGQGNPAVDAGFLLTILWCRYAPSLISV